MYCNHVNNKHVLLTFIKAWEKNIFLSEKKTLIVGGILKERFNKVSIKDEALVVLLVLQIT